MTTKPVTEAEVAELGAFIAAEKGCSEREGVEKAVEFVKLDPQVTYEGSKIQKIIDKSDPGIEETTAPYPNEAWERTQELRKEVEELKAFKESVESAKGHTKQADTSVRTPSDTDRPDWWSP